MSAFEIRDFILGLPWLYISLFVLFWIVVVLLLRKGEDGHAVLISWALRVFDVFLPNTTGARQRRADRLARDISYWHGKKS